MKVWFPAIRAGTGSDAFTQQLASGLEGVLGISARVTWFPRIEEVLQTKACERFIPDGTDVIHANARFAMPFSGLGIPVVVTMHSNSESEEFDAFKRLPTKLYHERLVRPRIRAVLNAANQVTAVSNSVFLYSQTEYGIKPNATISNWLPEALEGMQAPEAKIPPPYLMFAGRKGWHKGSDYVPAIASAIVGRGKLVSTFAKGDKSESGPIEAIGPQSRSDLWKWFSRVAGLVVPSRSEGFGLVALEAMAHGVPVIAFDGTGLSEVVRDGETGVIVRQGDTEGVARVFAEWLDSPERWNAMRLSAWRHATMQFPLKRSLERYMAIYADAINVLA